MHDAETEAVPTALVRFENGTMATVVHGVLGPDEVSRVRVDCERATVDGRGDPRCAGGSTSTRAHRGRADGRSSDRPWSPLTGLGDGRVR
ncbi:hypothetical protein GCM10020295_71160 [Streptomyces cinereospinus]